MSDNYPLYVEKMAALRAIREANRPLRGQLEALLEVVRECEARWVVEERGDGA